MVVGTKVVGDDIVVGKHARYGRSLKFASLLNHCDIAGHTLMCSIFMFSGSRP